jgi:DNA-binding MarR family transcriptional regulator
MARATSKPARAGREDPPVSAPVSGLAEQLEQDLSAIRRALRRPLETEMSRGGLTAPQTAAMRVVVRRHGISLRDLSREVGLAHSTVSGIVDRLEKRGIVERRPDPEDGRTSRIFPAAAVTQFVRERIPQLTRGPLQAALERAAQKERAEIVRALRRLRELLESE